MSERKSWDIQPKAKAPAPRQAPQPQQPARTPQRVPVTQPRPTQRPAQKQPQRRVAAEPQKVAAAHRRERVPQGKNREPLRAQRSRARKRTRSYLGIVLVLVIVGIFIALWQPVFRVEHVAAMGPDATGVQDTAESQLYGNYYYLIPKNSIFFFSGSSIRNAILQKYPGISAVSISRSSFDSLTINSIPRESAFIWCGETYGNISSAAAPAPLIVTDASTTDALVGTSSADTASSDSSATDTTQSSDASTTPPTAPSVPTCYNADSQGFIFSVATPDASSTEVLKVYDPLVTSSTTPLGEKVAEAGSIPDALDFVKAIKSLGVPVVSLVLRTDEADLYAQSGTRITYVLGHEKNAAQLAESAFPSLNINNGSLQYVDLRFDGKVYFKKVGDVGGSGGTSNTTASST